MTGGARLERTYALVVGAERYDAGADWNLDGPAADAARFVSWLVGRGVPTGQILAFVSPLAEPATVAMPPGVAVSPARRASIGDAISTVLPGWHGDLLWLYWAGHGVLTREDKLRLFYADASQEDKRNLDWNSLLTTLRSDRYPGLPRQAGIVDACQTYADRMQLAATLPDETFACGQPLRDRQQFGLYAAGPGQAAVNLGASSAGLFSREVMAELTQVDGQAWPPDLDSIADRLNQRFSGLRAAGQTAQTPTYFRWRSWGGSERVLGAGVAVLGPGPRPAPERASAAALRELIGLLLDIDVMARHDSRMSIIHRLRKGLATSIAYDSSDNAHVANVVSRCLRYPGGLTELVEAISRSVQADDPAFAEMTVAARRLALEAGQEWPE